MRIGYSHSLLFREAAYGDKLDGIGVYTKHLYEEINKHHKEVYPFDFLGPRQTLKQFFKKNDMQPATLYSNVLPIATSIHRAMEKQIDVFHCTDYRIPRLRNTPVVATLHDAIMLKNPELASSFRKLKNHILKRSALASDHTITVSHTMVEDIVEYWDIKPEKVSVVHNGIDDIWYETLEPTKLHDVLTQYDITKPFILTVGTLQPRKNILRLVQAFKNLPKNIRSEHQLVVVGKKGWDCDDIIQELKRLEQDDEGKWLQYVEFEDLRALYQAATLFAFPSLAEGFGFPIIESFASKTPVLASNTSSIPEIAEEAACLVNPESVDDLTSGLLSLLENESLRQDYIQKGMIRAQDFSWEKCAAETYKILSQQSLCT